MTSKNINKCAKEFSSEALDDLSKLKKVKNQKLTD